MTSILQTNNLHQLFLLFFNLGTYKNNKFKIRIAYRESKHSNKELTTDLVKKNNDLLIDYFNLPFEKSGQSTHTLMIENDTDYSRGEILNLIYSKTQQQRFNYSDEDYQKIMILSLFVPRGSLDLNHNYYSVDIIRENESESYISNLVSLVSSTNAIRQFNLNFRQLQHEYVENKQKRNTQVRINLAWLYKNYSTSFKDINRYKYILLKDNHTLIASKNINGELSSSFIERAIFYRNKIIGNYEKENALSKKGIQKLIAKYRKELNFDDNTVEDDDIKRSSDLIKLAIISLEDKCFCCCNQYELLDRTFIRANGNRPYLEVHHVISFGSDKNGDVLENLVKVCPACHKALTPGRAEINYQRDLIKNILNTSQSANQYVERFLKKNVSEGEKIDYVLKRLK